MRTREEALAALLPMGRSRRREDLEDALRILYAEEDDPDADERQARLFAEASEARHALEALVPSYVSDRDQLLALAGDFVERVERLHAKRQVLERLRQQAQKGEVAVNIPDALMIEGTKSANGGDLRRQLEAVTRAAAELRRV